MRVLVTGGSGRLGRPVVTELADRDHEVVSVDRAPGGADTRVTWITADLATDGEVAAVLARTRPDAVVHLAAVAVPFARPESELLRTNAILAFDVCAAAVAAEVRSVVLASSPTVVGYGNPAGWAPRYLPIDEEHPLAPWHAYALAKVTVENVAAMFANQVCDRVRLSAIRPCYVVGPDEWDGAPTQAGHTIKERLDRPDLAAASLFNYVDGRDVAELIAILLDPPVAMPNGTVFFAGAPDALSRDPLAEVLPRAVPSTAPFAGALTGTTPAFSTTKAQRLLGWRPRRSWRTELA